ncbi:MAG: hypothetical protein RL153_2093 [Verrucomicrobiota bacterium]
MIWQAPGPDFQARAITPRPRQDAPWARSGHRLNARGGSRQERVPRQVGTAEPTSSIGPIWPGPMGCGTVAETVQGRQATCCPRRVSSQPRNGRWAVCRPRALTRRWRCRMPGAPSQGTRPTAASSPPRPHSQGEPLGSCPGAHPPGWEGPFLGLKSSSTAVSRVSRGVDAGDRGVANLAPSCRDTHATPLQEIPLPVLRVHHEPTRRERPRNRAHRPSAP